MYEIRSVYEEKFSVEELERILKLNGNVSFYAFILHNQDVKEDGTLKKPHYHIMIEWTASTHKSITSEITKGLSQLVDNPKDIKQIKNKTSMARYLRHLDDCNKHQYGLDEVHSSDIEEYTEMCEVENLHGSKEIEVMLDDLVSFAMSINQQGHYISRRDVAMFCFQRHQNKFYIQNVMRIKQWLVDLGILVTD